jgi:3-methyladenine DNA glycosylase AlkC
MSQKLTVDLEKNPEVADLLTDMEVGEAIFIRGTIANMDDKTLEVRLQEVSDTADGVKEDEEAEDEDDEVTEDEEDTEE